MWHLFLAFALACGGEDSSSIIVELRTDLVPGVEFDAFELIDGERTLEREVGSDEIGGDWTASRPMGELETEPGTRRMRVRLRRAGTEIIGRDLTVVVEGRTGVQVVFTRDCTGVSCAEGEACFAGQCVPDGCISGLEPTCGFTPECATDRECVASNICAPLVCEPPGYCFPARFECPDQQYCDETTGCTPIPGMSDAGIPDVGLDAGVMISPRTWVRSIIAPDLRVPAIAAVVPGFAIAFEGSVGIEIRGHGESWQTFLNATPSFGFAWLRDNEDPGPLLQFEARISSARPENMDEGPGSGSIALDCTDNLCGYALPDATNGLEYDVFGIEMDSGAHPLGLSANDILVLRGGAGPRVVLSHLLAADALELRPNLRDDTGLGTVVDHHLDLEPFVIGHDGDDEYIAAALFTTYAPVGFDDATLRAPPGGVGVGVTGLAIYISRTDTLSVFAGDPSELQVLDAIGTTGDDPHYAVLITHGASDLIAPAGSAAPQLQGTSSSGPRAAILELDGSGLLRRSFSANFSAFYDGRGELAHFASPSPFYRAAMTIRPTGEEPVLGIYRVDPLDGRFTREGRVDAEEIADFAIRDARDVYAIGVGSTPIVIDRPGFEGGVSFPLDPEATGYILRHSVDR